MALNSALILCIAEVILLTGAQQITFGANTGGWTYRYLADFQLRPLIVGIAVAALVVSALHFSLRQIESYEKSVLSLWFVLGSVGQIILHSLYPYSLADVVRSGSANTFYEVSSRLHAYDLLSHYNALASSMPLHVKANMPGKVLLYQGLRLITEDPRKLAVIIIGISNLGGILLYFIVKRVYSSSAIALSALVLYLFIPAKIYFLPLLNIVSPIPVLAGLLLLVGFLGSHRKLLAILIGATLYAAIMFDPEPLALGLFFVAFGVRASWLKQLRLSGLLMLVGLAAGGFVTVCLAVDSIFHFDIVRGFFAVSADARGFNLSQGRSYSVWIWANLLEFFLNAGISTSVLCFVYLITLIAGAMRYRRAHGRIDRADARVLLEPGPLMLVTLLVTVAVLDLLGFNRGEVVRLWIYLTVFVEVVAAAFAWEQGGVWTVDVLVAGSIIQTAVTISMVGFIL